MRFLVVDDSSTMRRIIINTLNKLGYTEIVEEDSGVGAHCVRPATVPPRRQPGNAIGARATRPYLSMRSVTYSSSASRSTWSTTASPTLRPSTAARSSGRVRTARPFTA